jgi:hypothetical protein
MRLKRTDMLLMLPKEVRDNLPHPYAPERVQRLTEELLKVVDIPQGKYVLRALYAHNHYFFYVERYRPTVSGRDASCPYARRKGRNAQSHMVYER